MIEVRGLCARTDGAVLLDGVRLTARAGEITALAGPSGSGKTTTALALLGEASPGVRLSGDVRVAGVPVVDASGPTPRAGSVRGGVVAYMPQHPGSALNPARRIGPVLGELARLHQGDRSRAYEALGRAQLPAGTYRRFPHRFSGGQRQRVALAQVLACAPDALVLDEPSTGLDSVTRAALATELAGLARDGMTILLLSHDHALIRALADRVVLLDGGRVAATGGPEVLPPEGGTSGARATTAPRDAAAPAADGTTHVGAIPRDGASPVARGRAHAGAVSAGGMVGHRAPASRRDGRQAGEELLVVEGVTAWVRREVVVRDVRFAVRAGEAVAVVGRSGSGKTTVARCVAGLHERYSGTVRLGGRGLPVLRRRSAEQKRRVQYVWQEVRGSFDERRTVLDQVARTGVRLRGMRYDDACAEALRLLARLGVGADVVRRRVTGLSGGELQRAAFARAALARPDVLVCDEISTALDAAATEKVVAELARLRGDGTAVIWIGHDLRLVPDVADRVLILDAGRVAEAGGTREVLGAPRTEAARRLVEAARLGDRQPTRGTS